MSEAQSTLQASPVIDSEMPIRREDWSQIEDRIRDLQKPLAVEIERLRPRGWRRAVHFLREWGVLATVATVIVALLGIAATQWNAANSRLATEAAFRAEATERLKGIDKELLSIRGLLSALR